MCIEARDSLVQVAVLDDIKLVEHYASLPANSEREILGNVYLARVCSVLPGMEAAFIDIGTSKNAVLYQADLWVDPEEAGASPTASRRIESVLAKDDLVLCQVTKNPIGKKGARLTQLISLPGRFLVLVPGRPTLGVSKRLDPAERQRLREIVTRIDRGSSGVIVRTAAAGASEHELSSELQALLATWQSIEKSSRARSGPALLHAEEDLALRIVRERMSLEFVRVLADDPDLVARVRSYLDVFEPQLASRVAFYDRAAEGIDLLDRFHVTEQLEKALNRQVWLPSGGSICIDPTEAMTVIDVNTARHVGSDNLEQTVFETNLQAAAVIAEQLRLRDIGGIVAIDFIDMDDPHHRDAVMSELRRCLAADRNRSQVLSMSDFGVVQLTRRRVSASLGRVLGRVCPTCGGRGWQDAPNPSARV
jgi:ribonuclease E